MQEKIGRFVSLIYFSGTKRKCLLINITNELKIRILEYSSFPFYIYCSMIRTFKYGLNKVIKIDAILAKKEMKSFLVLTLPFVSIYRLFFETFFRNFCLMMFTLGPVEGFVVRIISIC